ncbi:hypothetical protein AV530_003733 [Patagioenas fasciata monilis]|uniref:Uncharacterized protein n=1 Tax=Patagioenas fasciata monilis TaxID=372326 RepID=A0A1V4KZZ9_PATFA|nr:hypothetical protein AV530_003733 [Patagioenas fasciata monilis]
MASDVTEYLSNVECDVLPVLQSLCQGTLRLDWQQELKWGSTADSLGMVWRGIITAAPSSLAIAEALKISTQTSLEVNILLESAWREQLSLTCFCKIGMKFVHQARD